MAQDIPDFSLTPEELSMDAEALRKAILAPAMSAAKARMAQEAAPVDPEYTKGMSGTELFLAGMGKAVHDPLVKGPEEMGRVMFRKDDSDLAKINADKKQTQKIDQALMDTWQGKLGNVVGQGGMAAVAPARLPWQVGAQALLSALSPDETPVSGTGNLLMGRLARGVEGAGSQYVMSKGVGALGKLAGAATKRYTPEGQEALRLDDAANRLGISRNLGSLDQSGPVNAFETVLPGYARTVEGQVKAFKDATKDIIQIPSKSGRSFTERELPGEKVRAGVVEAGENLKDVGKSMWNDLDQYIVGQNIPGVVPTNTGTRIIDIIQNMTPLGTGRNRAVMQLDKNPILARVAEYDPESANLLKSVASNPKKELPFSDLHQLQSAVGRAMSRAEKDAGAPGASLEDRQVRTKMRELYSSLMGDVDNWGTTNVKAKGMYDEAKAFWRDAVVPGIVNNKVFSKANRGAYGMNPRGYSEASQLYSDIVGNPTTMQTLYPYMNQPTRDAVDTLSTMPDLATSLIGNKSHPQASGMGMLTTLAGMAIGSPLQLVKGVVGHTPGISSVMNSNPAKRMYFARDVTEGTPLGRVANGMAQYPQDAFEGDIRDVRRRVK